MEEKLKANYCNTFCPVNPSVPFPPLKKIPTTQTQINNYPGHWANDHLSILLIDYTMNRRELFCWYPVPSA